MDDLTGSELLPPIVGKKVFLRPIYQADYEFLRTVESSGANQVLYRFSGTTPSPEEYVARLWTGVLAQFMVCRKDNATPVSLVACYGADFRNGVAYLAAIVFPGSLGGGWPLEGTELFIDYLFSTFPFRKLYGETNSAIAASFPSTFRDVSRIEGRLIDHEFVQGQYRDKIIMAIHRDAWNDRVVQAAEPSRLAGFLRERLNASASVGESTFDVEDQTAR